MRSILMAALLAAGFLALSAAPPRKTKAAPLPPVPAAGAPGEILDLASGRTLPLGPMLETRTDFQLTPLPEGRVLVSGGSLKGATSEVLDPATGRFAPGPSLVQARSGHRALRLKDGRILLVGGTEPAAPAEVLEPGATVFKPLPGPAFGLSAEAVELPEGVLLVDGASRGCWIWQGKEAPRPTGGLQQARIFFRATALPDGRVLVTGGWPQAPTAHPRLGRRPAPAQRPDLPVECYTPRKGRWSLWKGTLPARAGHQATLLKDGRVLLLGGFGPDPAQPLDTAALLDTSREALLDPLRAPGLGLNPGLATLEEGLGLVAERAPRLRRLHGPEDLKETTSEGLPLANAFLAPQLLALPGNRLLVLGSPVWGPALERWDPRTGQFTYIGALRAGTERLMLDGKRVLAVGPVVDAVDPRTGALTPLGRREALATTLAKARPAPPPPSLKLPAFPDGQPRLHPLVVALDARRALVMGGGTEEQPGGTDQAFLLDLRRKRWTPTGSLRSPRAFTEGQGGALRLPDGSVLVWAP